MKLVGSAFAIIFVIILGCIAYLMKTGVSIRTAPYIRPSVIANDFTNVPWALFARLYPEMQSTDYFVWGVSQALPEVQITLSLLKERYEKEFNKSVSVIVDGQAATSEQIQNCEAPCWIYTPVDKAYSFEGNSWIDDNIRSLGKSFLTLTWMGFEKNEEVSEFCHKQQRLTLDCVRPVSVREVVRKMKDPDKRYFFLRKYLDHDFFLFIESSR